MGKLLLSAFTDEYANAFDAQIEAARKFDLKYLELRNADGKSVAQMTRQDILEYRKKLTDNGIGVSAIGSPLGKIKLDDDLHAHLEIARNIFEHANILGTRNIRMFSFYGPQGISVNQCRQQVLDTLEKLVLLARQFDVTLCHENEALIYGDTPQRCKDLLEYFGGELKCVFDMGNFVLEGVEPYEAYLLLKDHIQYFHIKDALSAGAVVPPGKGEANIQKILLAHMSTVAADTWISLEPHLQTFSGLNALAGRKFDNPYQYPDQETAFADAVTKLKEMIQQ